MDQVDMALKGQGYSTSTIGESYYNLLQLVTNRYLIEGGTLTATSEEHETLTNVQLNIPKEASMADVIEITADEYVGQMSLPANVTQTAVLTAIAALAARYGIFSLFAPALAPAAVVIGATGVALELIDLGTPGLDIPSLSDIPAATMAVLQGKGWGTKGFAGELLGDLDNLIMTGSRASRNGGRQPLLTGPLGDPFRLGMTWDPNTIVKTWEANGTWFALTSEGKGLVQRKDGRIKEFTYKKPIVLNRKGAKSVSQLLSVYGWVDKQFATLDKAMKKHGYGKKARASSTKRTVITDGVTQIKN
jgi:hypothetical protein